MTIRPAIQNDLPAILEIFNYEIIQTPFVYLYEPWTLHNIQEWFKEKQKKKFPLYVTEVDDTLVAYATYGTFRAREAYNSTVEYSVYVHKDYRQQGVARLLVKKIIDKARQDGFHAIIGGLDSENQASYDFHKKLEFKEVARINEVAKKFDTWRNLILFQLILQ